jgi:hypothetical protein
LYGFSPSSPEKGFFWAMERNFGEILPLDKNLGLRFPFLIVISILVEVWDRSIENSRLASLAMRKMALFTGSAGFVVINREKPFEGY